MRIVCTGVGEKKFRRKGVRKNGVNSRVGKSRLGSLEKRRELLKKKGSQHKALRPES